MAIILDKDNNVVTYENQPEQTRAMFPNLCDCQDLAAQIEILESEIADLKEEVVNKTDYIYDTAQGAVASFSDGADDAPIKSLIANINPVQDLHGYDAPWPAGGGKNLLNPAIVIRSGTISYESGLWTMNPFEETFVQIITIPFASNVGSDVSVSFTAWATSETTVRFDGQPDSVYPGGTDFADKTLNLTASKQRFSYSGTVLEGTTGFRIFRTSDFAGAQTVTVYVEEIQIEVGSTATSYAPYSNICPITGRTRAILTHSGADASEAKTIIVIWESEAGTVYGGAIDVITGVLTVDRAMVDLGTLTYSRDMTNNQFQTGAIIPACKTGVFGSDSNFICTMYESGNYGYNSTYNDRDYIIFPHTDGSLRIRDSRYTNVTDFTAAVSGQILVYPLATPITYNLTPIEVKTLLGVNNISANTGNVSVIYPCDLKLYIDKKIAEVE